MRKINTGRTYTGRPIHIGLSVRNICLISLKRKSEGELDRPTEVETIAVPITANFFHPSGLFAELGGMYVHQQVERRDATTLPDTAAGSDTFWLFDATVGVRLPQRRGIFAIEGLNLFDQNFSFQDSNFRRGEIIAEPWIPQRAVLVRFTVNF